VPFPVTEQATRRIWAPHRDVIQAQAVEAMTYQIMGDRAAGLRRRRFEFLILKCHPTMRFVPWFICVMNNGLASV
jgi:hypothetical protein